MVSGNMRTHDNLVYQMVPGADGCNDLHAQWNCDSMFASVEMHSYNGNSLVLPKVMTGMSLTSYWDSLPRDHSLQAWV